MSTQLKRKIEFSTGIRTHRKNEKKKMKTKRQKCFDENCCWRIMFEKEKQKKIVKNSKQKQL